MLLSPTIPKMENNFHVRLCGFISTTSIVTYGWKVAIPSRRKKVLWLFPNISFTLHFTFFINLCFPPSSLIFLLFTGHLVFNSIWNIKLNQLRKPFSGWQCRHNLTETCYKQLQKYLRPHLGLNSISMILCAQSPVRPPPPCQVKNVNNTSPCSNRGGAGATLNAWEEMSGGGGGEVCYITEMCD